MWLIIGASVGGEEGASVVVVVVVEVVVVEVVVAVVVVLGVGLVLLICCKKFLLGGFLILDGRWVTICKVGGGGALVVGMVGSAVWPSSISGSVFSSVVSSSAVSFSSSSSFSSGSSYMQHLCAGLSLQLTTSLRHSLGFFLRMEARIPDAAGFRRLLNDEVEDDGEVGWDEEDLDAAPEVDAFSEGFRFIMAILGPDFEGVGSFFLSSRLAGSTFAALSSFSLSSSSSSDCVLLGSLIGLMLMLGLTRL